MRKMGLGLEPWMIWGRNFLNFRPKEGKKKKVGEWKRVIANPASSII